MSTPTWPYEAGPDERTLWDLYDQCQSSHDHASMPLRTCVFRQLRARGWTNGRIGTACGLSASRVGHLVNAPPEVER